MAKTTTLDTDLDPAVYEFEWTLDGVVLAGETNSTLVVSEPGEYGVIASNIGTDCEQRDTIVIEFNPPLPVQEPINLTSCQPVFDLTENTDVVLEGLSVGNYEIGYYASEADMENGITIPNQLHILAQETLQYM